jgi:GT2 family glycosyltransferase
MTSDAPTLPLVSIVIVSWNAREYLAECLESLTEKVYAGPMETIVVDNASSDGSAEMVRARFPGVRLVCNDQNLGFAKANNVGIRQARGEYLALVNSDVHLLDDCIGTLVAYCESDRKAGIIGPKIIGRDGLLQASCRGFPRLWNTLCRALALDAVFPRSSWFNGYLLRHQDHGSRMPADILSGCFWLVRREALDAVGLLDEGFFIYGEDMDWCKRFWQSGWTAMFVPEAQAIHYGGASSSNAPVRFSVEMQRADCQYWAKHHSRAASYAYVAISMLHHALRWVGHSLAARWPGRDAASHRKLADCSAACLKWLLFSRRASGPARHVAIEHAEGSRGTS